MSISADAHVSFGNVSWGQISTRQQSFAPLSPLSPPLTPPQTPNDDLPQHFPARNSPEYRTLAENNRIRKSKGMKPHTLQLNGPRKPDQQSKLRKLQLVTKFHPDGTILGLKHEPEKRPKEQKTRSAPGRSAIRKSKKVHLPHFFTPLLPYLPPYRVTKAPLAPKWDPESGLSRHEFFHIHRFFT